MPLSFRDAPPSSDVPLMRIYFALITSLAFVAAACANPTGPAPISPCAPSAAAATVNATDNFAFSPASVTITVGQSVCWQNTAQQIHTVTDISTNGTRFNGNLPGGQAFIRSFGFGGSFTYRCRNHAGMTGTVVVNCMPGDLTC